MEHRHVQLARTRSSSAQSGNHQSRPNRILKRTLYICLDSQSCSLCSHRPQCPTSPIHPSHGKPAIHNPIISITLERRATLTSITNTTSTADIIAATTPILTKLRPTTRNLTSAPRVSVLARTSTIQTLVEVTLATVAHYHWDAKLLPCLQETCPLPFLRTRRLSRLLLSSFSLHISSP